MEKFNKGLAKGLDLNQNDLDELNVGYHAGDLGKAESFFNQSSGRGTGHFGTGTYFVGNEDKIKGYNDNQYGKGLAPHHKINFSPYNLYRPYDKWHADRLHDSLKYINNHISYYDDNERKQMEDNFAKQKEKYDKGEMYYDEERKYKEDYDEYKDTLFQKDLVKNDLDMLFGKDKVDNALHEVQRVYNEYNKKGGWWSKDSAKWDSLSTVFMKALGYQGVDVRHIPEYDNTEFGSVIYDLIK